MCLHLLSLHLTSSSVRRAGSHPSNSFFETGTSILAAFFCCSLLAARRLAPPPPGPCESQPAAQLKKSLGAARGSHSSTAAAARNGGFSPLAHTSAHSNPLAFILALPLSLFLDTSVYPKTETGSEGGRTTGPPSACIYAPGPIWEGGARIEKRTLGVCITDWTRACYLPACPSVPFHSFVRETTLCC